MKAGYLFGFLLVIFFTVALVGIAMGQSQESKTTQELIQNLTHKDAKIRSQAAWALGKRGETKAVDPLIQALLDNDSNVREWAVLALVKIGKPAVNPLIAAIEGKDDQITWQAIASLGLIQDANSTEPLISKLSSNSSNIRYWSAVALGQIRDPDPGTRSFRV